MAKYKVFSYLYVLSMSLLDFLEESSKQHILLLILPDLARDAKQLTFLWKYQL